MIIIKNMSCLFRIFTKKPIDKKDIKPIDKKDTKLIDRYVIREEPNINDIIEIIISDRCLESDPCHHDYILILNDDTKYYGRGNGINITKKYWNLLSEEDKYHFYSYKRY